MAGDHQTLGAGCPLRQCSRKLISNPDQRRRLLKLDLLI